uniref:Serpin 7 n=1 Tax=Hadrurus spadix TaxID=141984 RepID=A0A1W7R9L1_9SCOR
MESAIASSNGFNIKLLQIYRKEKEEGNIFYSSTSITIALAMLYCGAREKTKEEMEDILNLGDQHSIQEGFCCILNLFLKLPSETVLNISNMLAIDKKYKILPEFSNSLKSNYNVETKLYDFANHPAEAQAELNQLIEIATNEKIKKFFPDGIITSDVCMILANAIYFKGLWSISFNKDNTTKKPFYTIADEEIMVDMMFRRARFRMSHSADLNARFLEMPYIGDKISMILMLPLEKHGISFLENSISVDNLNNAIQNLRTVRDVRLSLPRFKLEESLPLKQCLMNMGMRNAFATDADFSGISGKKDISISAALHKAFVEVNEEGTEASAVTGMVMVAKSSSPPPPPTIFIVDHPFMFVIREMSTGLILFTGSIHKL